MWHHVMLLDAMNPEVKNSNDALNMRHIRSITGGRELSKDLARQSLLGEPIAHASPLPLPRRATTVHLYLLNTYHRSA